MILTRPENTAFRNVILCIALAALTFSAFDTILENDFILYDDPRYVTENPHVRQGLTRDSMTWVFQTTFTGNWIPVTWLTHLLDVELYGASPKGHHLNNLILHIGNVLLVFALFQMTTKKPWISAIAAVLFAIHPLRVESVAWVSERKDVLSGFFGLSACITYVLYARSLTRNKRIIFYILTLILLTLGLMSKPMLVTWPLLFLLLDFWPLKRLSSGQSSPPAKGLKLSPFSRGSTPPSAGRGEGVEATRGCKISRPIRYLVIEKIPFFCLSVLFSVIAFYAQKQQGAVTSIEQAPVFLRLGNALISYRRYVGKFFVPTKLALLYPVDVSIINFTNVILSVFLLSVITLVCVRLVKKKPYLFLGWLWFLGTLVPVIGLVHIGTQALADRYTYLPSIGLSLMVAFWLGELSGRGKFLRIAVVLLVACAVSILLPLTWLQAARWKNSISIFRHSVHVTKNNYTMQMNYAYALSIARQFDQALAEYQTAAQMKPLSSEPLAKLGEVCIKQGRYEQAVAYLLEALEKNKDVPLQEVYNNLGIAYAKQGRFNTAIDYFEKSLEINPANAETLRNAAKACLAAGEFEQADAYVTKALQRVNPKEQPELLNRLHALQREILLERNKSRQPMESPAEQSERF